MRPATPVRASATPIRASATPVWASATPVRSTSATCRECAGLEDNGQRAAARRQRASGTTAHRCGERGQPPGLRRVNGEIDGSHAAAIALSFRRPTAAARSGGGRGGAREGAGGDAGFTGDGARGSAIGRGGGGAEFSFCQGGDSGTGNQVRFPAWDSEADPSATVSAEARARAPPPARMRGLSQPLRLAHARNAHPHASRIRACMHPRGHLGAQVSPRSPTHKLTHMRTHTLTHALTHALTYTPPHARTRKLKIQRTHARTHARTRARARTGPI